MMKEQMDLVYEAYSCRHGHKSSLFDILSGNTRRVCVLVFSPPANINGFIVDDQFVITLCLI